MNDAVNNPPFESPNDADAAFDDLLRAAMQARPEPAAPPDLATRAMALGAADDHVRLAECTRKLAQQRRWAQITSIAAALLIVAMLAGAARTLWTRGDISAIASSSSTTDSSATDADASTTTTSTGTSSSTIVVVAIAELLVLGIILTSLKRRTLASPWGAEVAGMW